jgi:hypothetical protein
MNGFQIPLYEGFLDLLLLLLLDSEPQLLVVGDH